MQPALTVILLVLLAAIGPGPAEADPATPVSVDACGEIVRENGCLFFWTFDEAGSFVLPETLSVETPGDYRVIGEGHYLGACGGTRVDATLTEVQVQSCVPDTFGCGILVHTSYEYECDYWVSLDGHRRFHLGDLHGYALGDTTVLTGVPCYSCAYVPGICDEIDVRLEQLFPCPAEDTPVLPASWGRIKARYRGPAIYRISTTDPVEDSPPASSRKK